MDGWKKNQYRITSKITEQSCPWKGAAVTQPALAGFKAEKRNPRKNAKHANYNRKKRRWEGAPKIEVTLPSEQAKSCRPRIFCLWLHISYHELQMREGETSARRLNYHISLWTTTNVGMKSAFWISSSTFSQACVYIHMVTFHEAQKRVELIIIIIVVVITAGL